MTDPTVDALARAAQAAYLRDAIIEAVRAQDGVGGVKAFAAYEDFIRAEAVALADAGYVVVRAEDVERLRALSEAATPGPWQPYIAYSGESGTPDEVGIYAGAGTTHHGSENTVISDFTLYASEALPDFEFIVAAVNYVRAALEPKP